MNESTQLREQVSTFLSSRPDLGPADLAQYCPTIAPTTVRAFANGGIDAGPTIQSELRHVLDQARAGDILQPGGRAESVVLSEDPGKRVRRVVRIGTFFETQTVRKVKEVLDFCADNAAIGVITADFGVGKTEAVRAWRRKKGQIDSLYFEFDEFTAANKVEVVRMICEAIGMSTAIANSTAGRTFRALCDYLRKNPCLLIFDQCEMCRPRVCQVLRQIWDRTNEYGVGLCMLAAPILMSRLTNGKMVDLGALSSRIGIWAPLSGVTRSEMAAIVKQEGFTDVEDNAFDLWYRATLGSMRRLMRSLDLLKSRHAGKRISDKTIGGVAGMLWGMSLGEGL